MVNMAIPAGLAQALIQPQQPFTWGAGGKRMLPEDIARQREMGLRNMQSDYSPVQHWTQGIGRVADNLLGALDVKSADNAAAENRQYSDKVLQALMNPTTSPGAELSTTPGGNLSQVMADPYVSPQVRDMAMRQFEMAEFEKKERLKSQYGEPTETARLAHEAYPNDPVKQAEFIRSVARNKEDPFVNVIGNPDFGTFAGRQSMLNSIINNRGGGDAPDTLPPDYFDNVEGAPPPISDAPPPVNAITRAQYEGIVREYGKAEADRILSNSNIRVQ